jgi:hypothetical protein
MGCEFNPNCTIKRLARRKMELKIIGGRQYLGSYRALEYVLDNMFTNRLPVTCTQ